MAGENHDQPEASGVIKTLGESIPRVYYDIIARVCAGVPLVAILLWDYTDFWNEKLSGPKLAVLTASGYVVGLSLAGLYVLIWDLPNRGMMWFFSIKHGCDDSVYVKNKEAGLILYKMHAERTLSQNLFIVYLLIVVLNVLSPGRHTSAITDNLYLFIGLGAVLLLSAGYRMHRYHKRQQFFIRQIEVEPG
jgi:hypothetical protein